MVIDHVVMLVPDAAEAARELRERHGLGSETGPYQPFAGTRNHSVPLEPPTYLEFLAIENRQAAEGTEAGRRVLACELSGFGLFAWAVQVEDLKAVSRRVGIGIVRLGRWQAVFDRVGHTCEPRAFVELTIGGSAGEHLDWLGPHDLPLRFVDGRLGIREARIGEARIATAHGEIVIT